MIGGVEVTFDYGRFERVIHFFGVFPSEVRKVAKREFNKRIRIGFHSSLRRTPKRRYWERKDFVNDASRRAFFAKTKGKAYVRTGNLNRNERVEVIETDNSITFTASNPTPYDRWVKGNRQVKGHARTQWTKRSQTFDEWRDRTATVMIDGISLMVKERVKNG